MNWPMQQFDIHFLAESWYHSHVCMVNMKLKPGDSYLILIYNKKKD